MALDEDLRKAGKDFLVEGLALNSYDFEIMGRIARLREDPRIKSVDFDGLTDIIYVDRSARDGNGVVYLSYVTLNESYTPENAKEILRGNGLHFDDDSYLVLEDWKAEKLNLKKGAVSCDIPLSSSTYNLIFTEDVE